MIYNNAPIREAIFDIQVSNLENVNQNDIEKLYISIQAKYPKKKKILSFYGKFEVRDNNPTVNESGSDFKGVIFSNKEDNRQVQFRVDGFTLNFLSPYTNWEDFYTEAEYLWNIYYEALKPKTITRIGLRYLNKIDIPLPFKKFQEYIVNMPPVPKSLPQRYSSFFMQIEVPCENNEHVAIITETIETPTKDLLPFILDIDVFKEVNNDFDFKDFNQLRTLKNLIFEDFITDKTRALFNS